MISFLSIVGQQAVGERLAEVDHVLQLVARKFGSVDRLPNLSRNIRYYSALIFAKMCTENLCSIIVGILIKKYVAISF
jgi:hypothetical protein